MNGGAGAGPTSCMSSPASARSSTVRGPSGASRSLVLWDGIPLNDSFGNWVCWNRLPARLLTVLADRIEVARGGASPLFSRNPAPAFRPRAGELGVRDGEASHHSRDFGFLGTARLFNSEGSHRIRESKRSTVDEPAGVDFRSAVGRVESGPVLGVNYTPKSVGTDTANPPGGSVASPSFAL